MMARSGRAALLPSTARRAERGRARILCCGIMHAFRRIRGIGAGTGPGATVVRWSRVVGR